MLKATEHMVLACDTATIPRDMYQSILVVTERQFLDATDEEMDKARTRGLAWAAQDPKGGPIYKGLVFVVENPDIVQFRKAAPVGANGPD